MHPKLSLVDLFTGLGGFTLALADVCKPMLYCDVDPHVISTLESQMADGRLPKAKIVNDVRNTAGILEAVADRKVDVLTASSPCVGFSSIGSRAGLEDEHSSLLLDTIKLVKILQPTMVIFENVPGILSGNEGRDVKKIIALMSRAGYTCRWSVASANDVGLPQMRKRWFCLAVKSGAKLPRIPPLPVPKVPKQPPVVKRARLPVDRYRALGNAFVPASARLALDRMLQDDFASPHNPNSTKVGSAAAASTKFPPNGFIHNGTCYSVKVPTFERVEANILVDPDNYSTDSKGRGRLAVRSPLVKTVQTLALWPTPRYSCPGLSNRLSERTIRDLPSVAIFASQVGDKKMPKTTRGDQININFVEWLQGFPIDHSAP
jgi:DNA-cytosine methyltransferase